MNERAVIFGRDSAAYENARPGYPAEAIDHVNSLVEADRAVEVGAGTGKATVDLARADLELICIEPSAEMAAVLAAKNLPGVSIVVSTYEDWRGEEHSMDLMFAAQAWHWVDRRTAYDKALSILRPGGALALMWNVPVDRYAMFESVYAQHAPELPAELDERIKRRDSDTWLDELSSTGFERVERFTHRWSDSLGPAQIRALYSTYSDHMMLPEPNRERLLAGLADTVYQMGGQVEIEYNTNVFTGRASA